METPDERRYIVFMETIGQAKKNSSRTCLICNAPICYHEETVVHYGPRQRTVYHEACLTRYVESGHQRCPCCRKTILTLLSLPHIPFVTTLQPSAGVVAKTVQPSAKNWEQYYEKLNTKSSDFTYIVLDTLYRHKHKVETCMASYERDRAREAGKLDQGIATIWREVDAYVTQFEILCDLGHRLRSNMITEGDGQQVGRPRPVEDEAISNLSQLLAKGKVSDHVYEESKQQEMIKLEKQRDAGRIKDQQDFNWDRIRSDFDFVHKRKQTNTAWLKTYYQQTRAMLEQNKETHLQIIAQKHQDDIDKLWSDLYATYEPHAKTWKWPKEPPPMDSKPSWKNLRRWVATSKVEMAIRVLQISPEVSDDPQKIQTILYGSRSDLDAAHDIVLRNDVVKGKEQFHEVQQIIEQRLARLGLKYL